MQHAWPTVIAIRAKRAVRIVDSRVVATIVTHTIAGTCVAVLHARVLAHRARGEWWQCRWRGWKHAWPTVGTVAA